MNMKAIVYRSYGSPDVLRYEDVDKPTAGDNEVLIRVNVASVNPLDWHFMRGKPYVMRLGAGVRKPNWTRLGVDVAGQVEATGRSVTRFKPGDQVFGGCRGAFAEYVCTSESRLISKPEGVTFEQAATVPVAAFTALQGLRDKGRIQPGQHVLVNGAAGGVGTFAVQIAKSFGTHVTGVCSTANVEMVRSIGADQVIDYTHDDFTTRRQQYDLLLDCIGNRSLFSCVSAVTPRGTYVVVGGPDGRWLGPLAHLMGALALSPFVSQRVVAFIAKPNQDDLATVCELMTSGKLAPVIGRRYRLCEAADAIRYLETGHARGKVVVTMNGDIR
jgi:NADPH:quinone reductase-like Zn-dependent oxidoreductase